MLLKQKRKWTEYSSEELTQLYFIFKTNPYFFFCEAVKLPTPGGVELFEPYKEQIDVVEILLKHHYLISLKSRQIGISTIVQAFIVWMMTFYSDMTIGVISKDGDEAVDFVRKTWSIYDELPFWLKRPLIKKREKSFSLDNRSAVYAATVNPHKPQNIFRSKSLTFLAIDEAAFVEYIDEAFTGISPTMSTAHSKCKRKGIPYGCVIMSTPNGTHGIGQWYFNQWNDAKAHVSKFVPYEVYWRNIPIFRNDPDWYETQCQILKEKWKIDQELELKFIAPQDSVFTGEDVEYLQSLPRKPIITHELKDPKAALVDGARYEVNENPIGSAWYWYDRDELQRIANDDTRSIAVTVDSATMYGSDKSVIEIFDLLQLDQIGEIVCKCRVDTLIAILEELVMPMFPNALLVIELNNPGNQLIEYFTRRSQWSDNLYHHVVYDKKLNLKEKRPGLATTSITRPLIIDSLFTTISDKVGNIKSERLINQLISLKHGRNNRIEGSPHDDIAMAFSFACYIRQYCLQHAFDKKLLPKDQTNLFIDVVASNENDIEITNLIHSPEEEFVRSFNESTPSHIKIVDLYSKNNNRDENPDLFSDIDLIDI